MTANSVPIVAMTAHSGSEMRQACAKAGMDDYVTKPVDFVELATILARIARPATRELSAVRSANPVPASDEGLEALIAPSEPLRRLGGDEALYLEILSIFISETPGRKAALEAARESSNLEALRRLAHGLRGSSKTIGAEPLSAAATALENAAASQPPGLSPRLLLLQPFHHPRPRR